MIAFDVTRVAFAETTVSMTSTVPAESLWLPVARPAERPPIYAGHGAACLRCRRRGPVDCARGPLLMCSLRADQELCVHVLTRRAICIERDVGVQSVVSLFIE